MVVASLLYAVCLYRAYGALDTLSPYIYYELLSICITQSVAPALSNESHLRHAIVTCVVNYTSKSRKSFEVKLVLNKPQLPYLNTKPVILTRSNRGASLAWPDPIIAQGGYRLQYKLKMREHG